MIDELIKRAICVELVNRETFKETSFEEAGEEAYLTYHCIEMFNGIVINEEYDDDDYRETSWLFYDLNTNKLRECNNIEDEYLREGDGNSFPLRDLDECEFLVSKDSKGICYFDNQ